MNELAPRRFGLKTYDPQAIALRGVTLGSTWISVVWAVGAIAILARYAVFLPSPGLGIWLAGALVVPGAAMLTAHLLGRRAPTEWVTALGAVGPALFGMTFGLFTNCIVGFGMFAGLVPWLAGILGVPTALLAGPAMLAGAICGMAVGLALAPVGTAPLAWLWPVRFRSDDHAAGATALATLVLGVLHTLAMVWIAF